MVSRILQLARSGGLIVLLAGLTSAQTNSCDVNGDGKVDVVDVQAVTNQEIGVPGFSCSANIAGVLGCSESARRVVIKAALGQGCHFVFLTWAPSPSSRVVGYNIYRGTSSGDETGTALNTTGPVTTTQFADTTAVAGIKYYYVVKATDGVNESAASEEVSATAR